MCYISTNEKKTINAKVRQKRRYKMNTRKFLNGFLVVGLVVAATLFVGLASPVFADHDDAPPPLPASERLDPDTGDVDPVARRISLLEEARQHTGTNKVLFYSLAPGEVVSQYILEGSRTPTWNDMSEPNGRYAGSQVAPLDGKPLEFFAPVSDATDGSAAKVNNFFTWSEAGGWQIIDSLIATPSKMDRVY